jgi:hypothetical protein
MGPILDSIPANFNRHLKHSKTFLIQAVLIYEPTQVRDITASTVPSFFSSFFLSMQSFGVIVIFMYFSVCQLAVLISFRP